MELQVCGGKLNSLIEIMKKQDGCIGISRFIINSMIYLNSQAFTGHQRELLPLPCRLQQRGLQMARDIL